MCVSIQNAVYILTITEPYKRHKRWTTIEHLLFIPTKDAQLLFIKTLTIMIEPPEPIKDNHFTSFYISYSFVHETHVCFLFKMFLDVSNSRAQKWTII